MERAWARRASFCAAASAAVQDVDFRSAFFQAKHCGAGRASGAEHEDFRVLQSAEAALERANHSRRVGVEAVELAVLGADDGVAGADLGGVRVGVVEIRKDGFLVRHGDAEAVDGNLAHAVEQVFESLGMEREVDGVDVLAAEGRIHDRGRERVGDRVSGNAVDAGGGVDGVDAVDAAQLLRGGLAGGGFFSRLRRRRK